MIYHLIVVVLIILISDGYFGARNGIDMPQSKKHIFVNMDVVGSVSNMAAFICINSSNAMILNWFFMIM